MTHPKQTAPTSQPKRKWDNTYAVALRPLLGGKEGWVEAAHVWDALGIPLAQRNVQKLAFGLAMGQLGWSWSRKRMAGRGQVPIYVRGGQPRRHIVATPNEAGAGSVTLSYGDEVQGDNRPIGSRTTVSVL